MYKIDADVSAFDERMDAMRAQLEDFPAKMADAMDKWQVEELRRGSPDTERPDSKSVRVRKRGRGTHPHGRALRRLRSRIMRKLVPKPVRVLRRYARIGRTPSRVLMPAPIRRLRRFEKQMRRVQRGKPTAVARAIRPLGRVRRMVRQAELQADLWEALTKSVAELAKENITWKK